MADSLEFLNLGEFQARALAAMAELKAEGVGILETTGEHIAEEARALAPVSPPIPEAVPGELRDSIYSERDGEAVYVGARAPFASYVEFGTVKMRAEPFMRPVLHTVKVEGAG